MEMFHRILKTAVDGGSSDIHLKIGTPEAPIVNPGYLVIAAVIYAVITSTAVILVASRFVVVSERTNQAEAEYRYALTRVRENGESIALLGGEKEERAEDAEGDACYVLTSDEEIRDVMGRFIGLSARREHRLEYVRRVLAHINLP